MKTVGVNISHDSSFCRCINGEVSVFLEEERLSRRKHDEIPTQILLELLEEGDELNFTGLESLPDTTNDPVTTRDPDIVTS